MAKRNVLADKLTSIAQQQLHTSWNFKLPRINRIKDYRRLYNSQVLKKLRTQFNVPLPVFSGMIDTLQADLDDKLIIEYGSDDPADYKATEKLNVAIKKYSTSSKVTAQWDKKHRLFRHEMILTGRGIEKFTSGKEGGYTNNLGIVPFEDFFFEPLGGGSLENHLFAGEQNICKTSSQLKQGVKDGIYNKENVALLVAQGGEVKMSGLWDTNFDFANRFKPLGLDAESNNYVGETVFNLVEWIMEYEGNRWYILFEPYSGTWVRFEKWEDIDSSGLYPWMSAASHEDPKNFASKAFADDLYPVAESIITLFNQELTNRQKRNLNAKAYDKDIFKDVEKLDEAQYRPDALVPADTKGGTRRISEGLFAFETPLLSGTVDLISWLNQDTGKSLGVTDLQQGQAQAASKRVGVTFMEQAQINKRLSYMSQPFIEIGQQIGERFFSSLKDNMTEPMAIKLIGENGIEIDVLKRIDLNVKKDLEISISSENQRNQLSEGAKARKEKALSMTAGSPNINPKVRDEMILKDIGEFSDYEVSLLLDVSSESDKETQAEVAATIQEIVLRGKKPKINYNADMFFIKRLIEFAKKHQDTLSDKKFRLLMECADAHRDIAMQNTEQRAVKDARAELQRQPAMGAEPPAPESANVPQPGVRVSSAVQGVVS